MEGIVSSFVLGLGMLAAVAAGPFSGVSENINSKIRSASDRGAIQKIENMRGKSATSTPAITAAAIACVGNAVSTREQSLVSVHSALSSVMSSSYSVRANALKAAYAQTDVRAIQSAVEAAWKAFNTASREAQKKAKESEKLAWKTFDDALKTCRGSTTIQDHRFRGNGAASGTPVR